LGFERGFATQTLSQRLFQIIPNSRFIKLQSPLDCLSPNEFGQDN